MVVKVTFVYKKTIVEDYNTKEKADCIKIYKEHTTTLERLMNLPESSIPKKETVLDSWDIFQESEGKLKVKTIEAKLKPVGSLQGEGIESYKILLERA